MNLPSPPAPVAERLGPGLKDDAHAAAAWTDSNNPERARRITEIPALVVPAALRSSAAVLLMRGLSFLIDQARKTDTIKGHLTRRKLQPIGLLHLEELVITPLDVERGELVYTLPLAPGERVTLSHKEWSLRQEEYSRFVQDYFENYSERGVAEKTDIAVTSKSETEHTNTMSMGRPIGPGSATLADTVETAGAAASSITKEKRSQEQSRRDTKEITEKASALSVRDQKISFTVSTVSGTEDFTSRLYENPEKDKVMIIDYFRRMRKWKNQLFRTGIRLTYDVVLPDPGRRLRARWSELAVIDAELGKEFEFFLTSNTALTLKVDLNPSDNVGAVPVTLFLPNDIEAMSAEKIEYMAREYGVSLPPTPDTLTSREEIKAITGADQSSFALSLDIPDDYRPTKIWLGGRLANADAAKFMLADYWKGRELRIEADGDFHQVSFNIDSQESRPPTLSVGFTVFGGATGEARAGVKLTPTPAAWRKWRSIAYAQIRQGAIAKWHEKRELLRQRRAQLLKELTAPDTLSLRRMEREQIMYVVLEWLFPDFGQASQNSGASESMLEFGEYIKFVHEAIDWDRVLVLLYPYFWDRAENHASKLYLDHPDGTHKEFLRAGASRIILAIKPGFEEDVIALLDKGQLGKLAPAPRFEAAVAAVKEAESEFAKLRAAATALGEDGEPGTDTVAAGELIGAWHDWTPTSAMDMDVTVKGLQPA